MKGGLSNGCQRPYGSSKLIDNGRSDSYILTVWHTTFGQDIYNYRACFYLAYDLCGDSYHKPS